MHAAMQGPTLTALIEHSPEVHYFSYEIYPPIDVSMYSMKCISLYDEA